MSVGLNPLQGVWGTFVYISVNLVPREQLLAFERGGSCRAFLQKGGGVERLGHKRGGEHETFLCHQFSILLHHKLFIVQILFNKFPFYEVYLSFNFSSYFLI